MTIAHAGRATLAAAVLATLLPVAGSPAWADAPDAQYAIRRDWGGSAARGTASWGSNIPINLRYDQLSEQDKARLTKFYVAMGPGDEPPFPAEGLKPLHQGLVKASAKFRAQGQLILIASVDAAGTVTEVKALGSPGDAITQFAAQHLMITKFKPALCKGQPCAMQFPFAYDFR